MKNATKLVWLVMLFTSSIMFAFGQTGANQMTLEQAHAYDNSVVVKSGGGVDMSVPPQNRNVKAILIDETFDTGLPASWFQIQYSGSNLWGWVPGIPTFSSYDPPNTDGNFACANGYNYGAHDVGLFTHSMNMSAAAGPDVYINVDRNFQDFAGNGDAALRVYSGGFTPANLELTLWSQTSDDPSGGVSAAYVIDPTTFADPSDVYLEFYYTCSSSTAWGFCFDNLVVNLVLPPGDMYGYVYNGQGLTIVDATVGVEAEGLYATTDPTGYYFLPGIPGGTVEALATKAGYNTIYAPVDIPPLGSIQKDWILTAPTMIIQPTFHEETLNPEEYLTTFTGILNTGDGPLNWTAEVIYPPTDNGTTIISREAPPVNTNGPLPSGSESLADKPSGNTDVLCEDCDPSAVFANPPDDANAYWSVYGGTFQQYQQIVGASGGWNTVTWYGVFLTGSNNPAGEPFYIALSTNNGPGGIFAEWFVTVEMIEELTSCPLLGSYAHFKYTATIDAQPADDVWLTIQNAEFTSDSWYWTQSPTGSGSSTAGIPLATCLTSAGGAGSWLTLDYYEGITPPLGTLENIPTNFDAQGTTAGEVYTADLVFTSFDPFVGTTTIPCTMIIAGDPLVPPTDLTAVLTDDIIGTVQLDWLWAGDAFQFFIVKRDGMPIGTSTTTQYIDTPLPDYGTYCYTVQSFYDEGYSVATEEVCVEWPLPVIFVDPTYHYAEVWVDHQHMWTTTVSNLGVGTLSYTIPPYQSCEHEIVMYDDWGDGWNGGTLDVFVDGDNVLSGVTLSSGSGPAYEYFEANNGSIISTSFTCGSWCYECSYYIYDGFGNLVFSDGVGGVNPTGGSGPAACPGFIVLIDPEMALVPEGSSQDVNVYWDATGFAPGLYFQEFFFESNDPVTPSVGVGNEMLVYVPAEFAGQVTECESGAPISGVAVTAGAWQTITDNNGFYSLFVDEDVYDVYFDKLGYESYVEIDTSAMAGAVTPLDVCLYEAPYPVPWVLATVDYPDEAFCEVEWSLPEGPYEIIYDDGVAEDLFVWSTWGNENAVKFTPLGYPATVIGGRLYVGDGSFPAGNWLGSEFAILVYAADGTDGLPGTMLDSIGVTVNNYGWVEFWGLSSTFDTDEEFYISMLQLFPSPDAAPLGIDGTLPNVYRSYSRTALGNTWGLSVYQDFMIRAYVEGSQTDVITDSEQVVYPTKVDREEASKHFMTANDSPFVGRPGTVKAGTTGNIEGYTGTSDAVLYYTVALMSDFDPDLGPATGTMQILNNVTELNYTDNNWAGYDMGWYAYAVQVAYSSGMLSPWTYSNIVGRDMDVEVIFEITLCDGNTPEDVEITLTGQNYPYETFFGVTDATGIYTFPQVWKGAYTIDVYKIGYENYNWDQLILADVTIPVLLSEKKYPPRNLWVDPLTSYAYWEPPVVTAVDEGFEEFAFPPVGWQASTMDVGWFRTLDGSSGWAIPAWDSYYACANDDLAGSTSNGSVDYLITPPLDLREVDTYRLMFDSYYDAFYGAQIATVEYSYDAGANWDIFYALTPMAGSWDYVDVDLASFSGLTGTAPIWFAFHADDGGAWASGWAIDNVFIANGETNPIQYHVYLDGAFVATTDTLFYQYAYLQYGTTYTSSVAAEYSCGLSEEVYYTFGSTFLLPPRNLDGLSFDDAVHVWWEKPVEPITDFSENTSVYDPNFVAVTDEADWVSNAPKPVGYKPLSTSRDILWDNGPLVNSPGTGAGGADESVLHSGLGTYGFGCQWPLGYQIADDFEVDGNWNVTSITVYGYQTNSGPPSSFIGCYLEIYDGDPSAGGSVIWGDLVTNVLTETDWTNIYRVNAVGGGTARPIMYLTCETPGLSLSSGIYWMAYSLDGTGSSGPWTPPITIDGVTTTGNALQNTGSWGPALDGSFQQGFPFLIEGPTGPGGGGGTPDNFIGYNLYRDMDNIAYIPWGGEDTTHYFDYDLLPLCYEYSVTAVYDLTPYGFPGETGESMHEGPMEICVEYGWPLAFVEDWSTGSFDPNLWDHGDNWRVNGQYGNPMPSAEFTWDPVLTDYKSALTSYAIDGKYHPGTDDPYIDGRIFFDFDLKLDDNGMSGNEMLYVAVWENGDWHDIASFSNADGSFDWTAYSFEISNYAFGEIFRVRFQAEGFSTMNILSWFVDNIHIYRQCDAPEELIATADGYEVDEIFLTWHAPEGGGAGGGGEWIMWDDGVNVNGIGLTGGGVFSYASHWDPDMIAQYDGMSITKVRFVPYINAAGSQFTLKVWEGANAGTLLHEQAVGSYVAGEWNEVTLTSPVLLNTSEELWFGFTVDSPDGENPAGNDDGPAVVGYGDMISLDGSAWDPITNLGPFDLNWNLQAYVADADGNVAPLGYTDNTVYSTPDAAPAAGTAVAGVSVPAEADRALLGYNIYWDNATGTYTFADFTEDTFYLHTNTEPFPVGSLQCYYVTAVYDDCEPASNEACWIVTGIEDPALADGVAVYPNPARDILNITSTTDITHVTVMNYVGQVVYNQKVVEDNDLQLSVAGYETGVYMVKVETTAGILIKKVTIAH